MNLSALRSLLTPLGEQAVAEAIALEPSEESYLRHFQALCRRFEPDLAQAALETAIMRRKAKSKTPHAEHLYFTHEALEQASQWEIALYRAGRLKGFETILDLGCSVGGDTLAFAQRAFTVGIDRDRLRLCMAQANARAMQLEGQVCLIQADLTHSLPLRHAPMRWAGFFDPARRAQGQRQFHVESYHPPLSMLRSWRSFLPHLAVKLSPAVALAELVEYSGEVEFISYKGELKEAVLWLGDLQTCSRRATLLPSAVSLCATRDEGGEESLPLSPPQAYLYEPDPAILRAGLVQKLGQMLNAAQMDDEIAYLTTDQAISTPFARSWRVESWFPFQLKRLRAYLRQHQVGKVTVKKRGSPLQPQQLIQTLRLQGEEERVLFLTHLRSQPIVVVAFPPRDRPV